MVELFNQFQFCNQVGCTPQFVETPEQVTNIQANGSIQIFIERNFMAEGLVIAEMTQLQAMQTNGSGAV